MGRVSGTASRATLVNLATQETASELLTAYRIRGDSLLRAVLESDSLLWLLRCHCKHPVHILQTVADITN